MDKSKELPILLKVVEEKYLQSTLSGNIFFGSLDLYKSAENQQGDKIIGDANEGKLKNETNVGNIRLEIKEPHMELSIPMMKSPKGKMTQEIRMKEDNNTGVCSFIGLSSDDFEVCGQKDGRTLFKLRQAVIDDIAKLLKGKEEFTGNKCRIILFDKNELMSRSEDIEVECGPVRYYDTTDVKEYWELVRKKIPLYLLKTQVYQYQREYRIVKRLEENKKGEVVSLNVTNIGEPITLSELANYILVYNVGLLQVRKLVKWVTEKK